MTCADRLLALQCVCMYAQYVDCITGPAGPAARKANTARSRGYREKGEREKTFPQPAGPMTSCACRPMVLCVVRRFKDRDRRKTETVFNALFSYATSGCESVFSLKVRGFSRRVMR